MSANLRLAALAAVLIVCGCAMTHRPDGPQTPRAFRSQSLSIVPRPLRIQVTGGAYVWRADARVLAATAEERLAARSLVEWLAREGIRANIVARGPTAASLHVLGHADAALGPEGYRLVISAHGVRIQANGGAGLFYGVQTLEQLTGEKSARTVQAVVVDRPAYAWRGIHLDSSRHYFAPRIIERFLDVAAHYKLNIFHWHLTDDQAWRLTVPAFPRLTSVAACHAGTCNAYSRAEVREIVAYAKARAMTVVPEIEMPGHSTAVRRAYPNAISAAFLQRVLLDVFALFPGPYVHIGGDEVVYDARRSAFMRRMEGFVRAHHRRAVVWNEAAAAGLSTGAIIMSWQGERAAARAAIRGYDVVATPDGPLYFDAYQGDRDSEPFAAPHMSTLEQVYDENPVPAGLRPGAVHHILGAQANVWTERIATADHLFYMVLPRELALAEIAWVPASGKNWKTFLKRLPAQLSWLQQRGYPFRIPNVMLSVTAHHIAFFPVARHPQSVVAKTTDSAVTLGARALLPDSEIRYTMDGSDPNIHAKRFAAPVRVPLVPGRAVVFKAATFLQNGQRSSVSECALQRMNTVRALGNGSAAWDRLVSP